MTSHHPSIAPQRERRCLTSRLNCKNAWIEPPRKSPRQSSCSQHPRGKTRCQAQTYSAKIHRSHGKESIQAYASVHCFCFSCSCWWHCSACVPCEAGCAGGAFPFSSGVSSRWASVLPALHSSDGHGENISSQ